MNKVETGNVALSSPEDRLKQSRRTSVGYHTVGLNSFLVHVEGGANEVSE